MKLRFYPLETGYTFENSKAVVQLFGRTQDNRRICVLDKQFAPYFWVLPANIDEAMAGILAENVHGATGTVRVAKVETAEKRFLGKEVTAVKVTAQKPGDVPVLRDALRKYGTVLEADILFTRRHGIDHGIVPLTLYEAEGEFSDENRSTFNAQAIRLVEETTPEQRILALDIETYNHEGKMPNAERDPIIMLALTAHDCSKVLTWKRFATNEQFIEFVDDERALIRRAKEIINDYQPDILTGYFSDGFDLPYIRQRADRLQESFAIGLDGTTPRISKNGNTTSADVTGMTHLDILNFIKKVHKVALKTPVYDLNSVGKEILGEGKVPVNIEELHKAWDTGDGLETFCKYNLQDALLTLRLTETLLPGVVEFAKLVGLPISDVSRLSFSQIVEWYLLREAKKFNELAPNRPGYRELASRRENRYEGGFVYEPKPGLFTDIVVFDFLSLYPTIISSHNISPDTLKADCSKEHREQIDDLWFCTDRKGFIPTVIADVINRRLAVKKLLKEDKGNKLLEGRQQALKTVANSIYGYFGFFGARWYSGECARAITAYGRQHIKEVIESAKTQGLHVLYGDTDSLFMTLEGKKKEDVQAWVQTINEKLPGIMELEYEGFYPSGIFVSTRTTGGGAKKKYALLNDEGMLKIRGFESVRRNLSKIAKETQQAVLDIILREHNPQKARDYVRQVIHDVREKNISIDKMVITTQLQRKVSQYDAVGPHVAVARRMQEAGLDATPGSIIRYVVTQGRGRIGDRAKLPDNVKHHEYDAGYYIHNQVLPAVLKILEVVGFTEEDVVTDHKQSTLGGFF